MPNLQGLNPEEKKNLMIAKYNNKIRVICGKHLKILQMLTKICSSTQDLGFFTNGGSCVMYGKPWLRRERWKVKMERQAGQAGSCESVFS